MPLGGQAQGKASQAYEMEMGLYQKLLLMAVVVHFGEHRGPSADVGTPDPMATFDLHRFSWALPLYCFSLKETSQLSTSKVLLLAKLGLPGDTSELRSYLHGPA